MVRKLKESYSDINSFNVWDAYQQAVNSLGYETLCENLARAIGTDALEIALKNIFREFGLPFNDDEDFNDEEE